MNQASRSGELQVSQGLEPCSDFYVVGIGASAGGLQPIEQFFEELPPDTGACFVVVQHLSPDFKSLMKELLGRRTQMPIFKVEEGMKPCPNAVYLIPPGQNLVIRDRQFHLTAQDRGATGPMPHYPIDLFFQSLAEDCGDRAIGVVLSGTGTDGTRGLQALNEAGGLTLVQAPDTAEFDGMINNAIETGIVDHILSPVELARTLVQLLNSSQTIPELRNEAHLLRAATPCLDQIVHILLEQEQVDFSYYKESTLSRRIQRRCTVLGFQSLPDYVQHLRQSEDERLILRSDLLIKVTYFFRNSEAWRFLERQILPGLIDIMEPSNPLRLWCAACATGEEAYSLAMLIHELSDQANRPIHAKIFATDLDKSALDRASAGIYPDTIQNDVPAHLLRKYFQAKDNGFEIKRQIREMVIFAHHNLVQDAGFTRLHFVGCRNVLIYMQSQLQQKVIRALNFSLRPNGILFMGESENLGDLETAFTCLNPRWKIYRKFRATSLLDFPKTSRDSLLSPRVLAKPAMSSALDPILEGTLRSLVARRGATCLVIDRHNCLIHVAGGSPDILRVPEGRLSNTITEQVVPSLKLPLTTSLNRARRVGPEGASYRGILLRESNPPRTVKLEVWLQQGGAAIGDYAIALIEADEAIVEDPTTTTPVFELDTEVNRRIEEVEYELQQTRENLQATIEELETTNEEQQATNEELIASNEELQSTNEELHSVNEELYTVNSEYQAKIQELLQLNNDIDNLLESTEIGVVFLDRNLAVRKFTPAARTVFRLMISDLGRPIGDLVHNLELENLEALIRLILEQGQAQSHEVKLRSPVGGCGESTDTQDHYLLLRLHPYHLHTGQLDGIVISFVDISRLKQVEQNLLDTQAQLQTINEALEQRVRDRTRVLQSFSNGLRELHQVATRTYDSETEVLRAYLDAGCSIFGLPIASLIYLEPGQAERSPAALGQAAPGHLVLKASCRAGTCLALEEVCETGVDFSWLPWAYLETKSVGLATLDPLDLDRHPLYSNAGIQSYLATQIESEGRCVGILEFAALEAGTQAFGQHELDMLELIAAGMAGAIARARDQQALLEREANYRRLYNETPVMLHSIDASGHLISVSDYWLEKLGYTREEVLGRKSTEFLTAESKSYAERVVLPEYFKTGQCFDSPYQFVRKDGGVLDVLLSAIAERDQEGNIVRSLAVLVDVTESRRLQQELEQAQALAAAKETADAANRAKSRFLASISHELRTPLNSILGFSELLERDHSLDAEQQEQVGIIRRAGQHLLGLINNVLDLSKIEAEQLVLTPTHFDLHLVLEQYIWSLFHRQAIAKGLTFEILQESDVPRYIYSDAVRLRQILINLISNALKFTERGEVTLKVSAIPILPSVDPTPGASSHLLRFEVTDTGVGIEPQLLPHIFDPFVQAENRDHVEGTGLGLNISQRLATLLGGEISINSQLGVGSTFVLTVPVQLAMPEQVVQIPDSQRIVGLGPGQEVPRILIVEDDADNQRFLQTLLQRIGFDCRIVGAGAMVVQTWDIWRPSLIFMDIQLPDGDGKALIREIKARPDGQQTRIVVLTASTFKQQQDEILTTGCDGYLSKPVTASQILYTLQQQLGVVYAYAEDQDAAADAASAQGRSTLAALNGGDLQRLSRGWLLEFHHALATGSTSQMYQLIDQLPAEFSEVAIALETLISQYRFQDLLDLLAPLCAEVGVP